MTDYSIPKPDLRLADRASSNEEAREEIRKKAISSLYFLTRAILGFKDLTPHLHMEICEKVQDMESNPHLMLLLPRKHFKSTITTIGFPIWLTIQPFIPKFGIKGCDVRVLIANESATNAEHFLSIIEAIFDENELFRVLFPEIIPNKGKRRRWNAQEMLIKREATWPEATIETIGVGGAAQSRHFDVRIMDDLIGKAAMDSETIMEDTIEWFDYSECLSISPQRNVTRVPGTRWSKRDLYEHIKRNHKEYNSFSKRCRENGEPIFPEWYTNEYYDNMMKTNFSMYSSQYLNDPTDPSKCDFKGEWLKYYTWEHGKDGELYLKLEGEEKLIDFRSFEVCGAFDPSVDEKQSSSRRAIVYAAIDSKQRVVLLDTYASRDSTDKVLDSIFEMYRKWMPRKFGVESVSLSRIYLNLIEKECKLRKEWVRAVPIKVSTRKSKDVRIRDTLQQVSAEGRLYVGAWMSDFIEEFNDFPNGATKDVVDAATHAINLLTVPDSQEDVSEWEKEEEKMIEMRSVISGY